MTAIAMAKECPIALYAQGTMESQEIKSTRFRVVRNESRVGDGWGSSHGVLNITH